MRLLRKLRYPAKRSRRNYIQHNTLSDATPLWMEILIVVVFSPALIVMAVYAGLKWFFTVPFKLRYPKTDAAKRMILTEMYLDDCRKYQSHEAKKTEVPEEVCQN